MPAPRPAISRASRATVCRQRHQVRSAVLRRLFRRDQGPFLRRRDGSPGILQRRPQRPGLRLFRVSRSARAASRSRHRPAIISRSPTTGSSSRRPASSIRRPGGQLQFGRHRLEFSSPAPTAINDIESKIGRLSLRGGTTIAASNMIWQPFGSASVFHEFAGDVTATFSTFPNAFFFHPPVGPAHQLHADHERPRASAPTASTRSVSPARSSTPAGSATCASTTAMATTSTAGPAMPASATSSRPK